MNILGLEEEELEDFCETNNVTYIEFCSKLDVFDEKDYYYFNEYALSLCYLELNLILYDGYWMKGEAQRNRSGSTNKKMPANWLAVF